MNGNTSDPIPGKGSVSSCTTVEGMPKEVRADVAQTFSDVTSLYFTV